MMQTEAIDVLVTIASASRSISEDIYFSVIDEEYHVITDMLGKKGIAYEDMGDNTISITNDIFERYKIKVYSSINNFFGNYKETTQLVIILGNKEIDSLISYTDESDVFFKQYKNGAKDHVITNFYYLKKIIDLLSQQKITDYKDTVHDRYFFLSPECGKLEINEGGLDNLVEIAKNEINLLTIYKKFMEMEKYQKGWEFILKNKIIKGLDGIDILKEGFKELIINLDLFLEATIRDYELFLNSRKHEAIVQQFENDKYIFADKIRSILQRISGNIISIPITFIGATVAIRDISDLWLINTIFLAMILFIFFTSFVNILFWGDLNIIKDEINMKVDIMSMRLHRLRIDLKKIIDPLIKRIIFIKILIIAIIILFVFLFVFFIYQYINTPKVKMIFV